MAFDIDSQIRLTVSGEQSLARLSRALEDAGEDAEYIELAVSEAATQMIAGARAADQYADTVRRLGNELNKLNKFEGRQMLAGLDTRAQGDIRASAQDQSAVGAATSKQAMALEKERLAVGRELERNMANIGRTGKALAAQQEKDAAAVLRAEANIARAQERKVNDLINTRYALYDTAAAYGSLAIGAGAVTAATLGTAMAYEDMFASVARTTGLVGPELENLRKGLVNLTQQMPQSFGNLTEIATIGAQLGIAESDIESFTRTVAMFSSTTDVSVDEASMAIGRLAQLTGTAGSELENLASAIYQTGVTSVATEGEILNVASEIATAGDLAGFSQHQIVALASSLASLGVQPEGARGSIMRLFGEFDKALDQGGEKLEKYSNVANMTAEEFSRAWTDSPQEAFSAFISGLNKMEASGANLKTVIKDLGIVNVRDEKLVSLLANNYEIYAQALDESASAYIKGSALADGFAVQIDTLQSSLEILKNTFLSLSEVAGQMLLPAFKFLVEGVSDFLNLLQAAADNKFGQVVLGISASAVAGVAVWATYRVAVSLLQGNIAALAVSKQKLTKETTNLNGNLLSLVNTYRKVAMGNREAINGVIGLNTAMETQAVKASKMAALTNAAGVALKGFTKAIPMMAGVSLAFTALDKIVSSFAESTKSAGDKFTEAFGVGGLSDAIKADTEAIANGAKAYGEITTSVESGSASQEEFAKNAGNVQTAIIGIGSAVDETSSKLVEQTAYIGENTREWLINALSTNEEFSKMWADNGAALEGAGFSLATYVDKMLEGTGEGAKYVRAFGADAEAAFQTANNALSDYATRTGALESRGWSQVEADRLKTTADEAKGLSDATKSLTEITVGFSEALGTAATAQEIAAKAGGDLTAGLDDTTQKTEELSEAMKSLSEGSSPVKSLYEASDAVARLGESLYNNGTAFDAFSNQGQANMSALQTAINAIAEQAGDDTGVYVANVMQMMNALEAQGVNTTNELDWVYTMLQQLAGNQYGVNFSTKAARENVQAFISDLIAMHQATLASLNSQVEAMSPFSVISDTTTNHYQAQISKVEQDLAKAVEMQNALGRSADQTFKPVEAIANGFDRAGKSSGTTAKNTGKTAKNAKDAAKEIKTVADIADTVSKTFDRAWELRFGVTEAKRNVKSIIADIRGELEEAEWPSIDELLSSKSNRKAFVRGEAKDSITIYFRDLKNAAAEARDAIRDAGLAVQDTKAKLQGLKSDEATLLFWRKVAVDYGNVERVMEIDAELAQNRADQAKATAELATQEADLAKARSASNNTSLTGNSDGAIENRANVRGLVEEHLKYIQALKDSGASQATIDKAVASSYADFMAQGKALGFNAKELEVYGAAIKDADKKSEAATLTQSEAQEKLEELTQGYLDTAVAMLNAGASQAEVNEYLRKAKERVKEVGKEIGATPATIAKVTPAFNDFNKVLKAIKDNEKVNVSIKALTPSEAAVKEYLAAYNNKTVTVKAQGTGTLAAPSGGWKTSPISNIGVNNAQIAKITTKDILSIATAQIKELRKQGKSEIDVKKAVTDRVTTLAKSIGLSKAETKTLVARALELSNQVKAPKMSVTGKITAGSLGATAASGAPVKKRWGGQMGESIHRANGGGFGTQRGRDTVNAWFDPQEFIMNREAHSFYGTDFMSAINEQRMPREFAVPVPIPIPVSAGNAIQLVEILPTQMHQIVQAVLDASPITPSFGQIAEASTYIAQSQVSQGRG